MNFRLIVAIAISLALSLGVSSPAFSDSPQKLNQLRIDQDQDFADLREVYDARARNIAPRTSSGAIDSSSKEYKQLLDDYSNKRSEIRNKYSQQDVRGKNLQATLNDKQFKGRIVNTGSAPANVNADVDLKANDLGSAKDLSSKWNKEGAKVEYYTVDDPRTPKTKPPENFEDVVKVVNESSDTTLWTPETENIRKAKIKDPDAWTTSGGQKGTGNIEMSRDKRGYFLDNQKKFAHADRPVSGIPGTHNEDLKTVSKSISKAGGEQGANIAKGNREFYDQAGKMRQYGDPVEAGIVSLGDPPEARKQKIEAWKETARGEMTKAQIKSQELGDAGDTAREELADQMRKQGHDDIANSIEENRQKVADTNRDAAAENQKLIKESEDLRKGDKKPDVAQGDVDSEGRGKGSTDTDVPEKKPDIAQSDMDADGKGKGDADVDTSEKTPDVASSDVDSEGRTREKGKPDTEAPPKKPEVVTADTDSPSKNKAKPNAETPETGQRNLNAGEPDIDGKSKKTSLTVDGSELPNKPAADLDGPGRKPPVAPDVDVNRVKTDMPEVGSKVTGKNKVDLDTTLGALEFAETAGQVFEAGTKQAGKSIDENRELSAGDVAATLETLTPGTQEYKATKAYLEHRRLESLRRQEKIASLKEKGKLTLDEKLELVHLEHEEAQNPNTATSDISAFMNEKVEAYEEQMKKRSKKAGRDKPEFFKDGLPMLGEMLKDAVNVLNPFNQAGKPVAEGEAEVSTWDERQAWASTKDDMTKKLNLEANQIDKRTRRNTNKLNQLLTEGDLTDGEVQKSIDALLEELQQDRDRLDTLNAAADSNLQEVDPEKLKYLRDLEGAMPDVWSLATWRDELTREQLEAQAQDKTCSAGSVKVANEQGHPQCVSCELLQGDFDALLSADNIDYAQSLLNLASTCGWTAGGRAKLKQAKPCPDDSVKLGNNSGQTQCTSCDALYGDYIVARLKENTDRAQTILNLSGKCGWSTYAVENLNSTGLQEEMDQRCSEKILFSRAVPAENGKYACVCEEGWIRTTISNSSACQNCQQLMGFINSSLQRNDIDSAKGLMGGAQSCGWFQEAIQVIANAEQQNQRRKQQSMALFNYDMQQLIDQIDAQRREDEAATQEYNAWVKNQKQQSSVSAPPKKKAPPKKTPPKKKTAAVQCPPGYHYHSGYKTCVRRVTKTVIIDAKP